MKGKIYLYIVSVDGVPLKVFTEHCNAEAYICRLQSEQPQNVRLTELSMSFRLSIFDGYE